MGKIVYVNDADANDGVGFAEQEIMGKLQKKSGLVFGCGFCYNGAIK